MIGAAAAYMSGLFFASFFTDAKGILMYSAALVLLVLCGRRKNFRSADYGIIVLSFIAAACISMAYTSLKYNRITSYDGRNCNFSGVVTDYKRYTGDTASYMLKGRINGGISVKVSYYGDDFGADYGDIVIFEECTLQKPESTYLSDTERYLRSQHIYLAAQDAKGVSVEHSNGHRLKKALSAYREKMVRDFRVQLGDECGGFLAGMVFGEKSYLDDNTVSALYRTGIGHVLAVSGLHVSMIAALIMTLLTELRLNKYLSFGIMNVFIMLFAALADYPVSVIRAAVMLEILYSAKLFYRDSDSLNSLAVAAFIISLSDPYVVYNSGFMLSLAGTFGAAVFAPYMVRDMKNDTFFESAERILAAAICTVIPVFPLCVYYFDETSVISPFVNVLLMPLCSGVIIIGAVYVITAGLLHVLPLAGGVLRTILWVSDKIASVRIFHISDRNGILCTFLMLSGALLIIHHIFREKRRETAVLTACSMAVFSVLSGIMTYKVQQGFTAAILGSGKNTVIVIVHDGHTELSDMSGHYRSAGYVRKYLASNGLPAPDNIILAKKAPSQYAVYEKELAIYRPASGDTELHIAGGGEISVSNAGCEMRYTDRVLEVSYRGRKMCFLPEDEKKSSGVYSVHLSSDTSGKDTVKCRNNTEIIFKDKDKYKIRRL
ncbi:MAG: ComEC family competence protein [Ruminococcus sp.]|nr:ComEC family competence protein [Ruminococcus sp.]